MIDLARWDLAALREEWLRATPFPHLVLDDVLDVAPLREAVACEPHWPSHGELFEMMASSDALTQPALARFAETLPIEAVAAISGVELRRIEARSYVYLPGSYLLPHTDFGDSRRVAWVLYLAVDCDGGDLRLYDCDVDGDVVTAARFARDIAPRPGRLVLFEVSPRSLHEVTEVTRGARVSLAGWFKA